MAAVVADAADGPGAVADVPAPPPRAAGDRVAVAQAGPVAVAAAVRAGQHGRHREAGRRSVEVRVCGSQP